MKREYTVSIGEKSTQVEAVNVSYAAKQGLDALGYRVQNQPRGRGVKAPTGPKGGKLYTVACPDNTTKSVEALDLFSAYTTAVVDLGGKVETKRRGRPVGSKNKNPRKPKAKPQTEGADESCGSDACCGGIGTCCGSMKAEDAAVADTKIEEIK